MVVRAKEYRHGRGRKPQDPPDVERGEGSARLDDGRRADDRRAGVVKTLSEEAHTDFDPDLSKADASLKIDELQEATGRGK